MRQVSFRMEDDLFRDVHIAAAAQGLKVGEAASEYALEWLSSKAYEVWQRNGKFD